MPGKCKFQDSWLSKGIYKEWLLKDVQDIHFARCRACCKSIKLQTMGEAALTSHAGGAGHKAAVRKLVEAGNLMVNSAGQINGSVTQTEDSKEQVSICLQRETLDRITGGDWSELRHSPTANSTSHNAELQDVTFPAAFFAAPVDLGHLMIYCNSDLTGTSRPTGQRLHPSASEPEEASRRTTQHDSVDLSRLEQQQQMKILEWENRMKLLAWEQELVKEKRRAARQKERAFRMKRAYYKAKLKRMGEDVPPLSSSSDDEEKISDPTG
ncbi:uncharacterized protein LOC119023535 isoform X2 [Acanthopagrus latus]|uniref:uncharacterized protein LOC119023535 isoform X2 n=1 Tax=Acanthopagrus latus TaxID=8177 RepID=UPI00187C1DCC|nr:uncharacterized protein LOC119023535 isoform X2 [Acanthopagrus latus]